MREPGQPMPMNEEAEKAYRQAKEDMACNSMRALTSVEMQQMEHKCAEELQAHVRSYLYFPTLENFQRIQEASSRYMTAWMNGRKRVLSD